MWNNVVVVYLFVKCASKTGGRGADILMVVEIGGNMGAFRNATRISIPNDNYSYVKGLMAVVIDVQLSSAQK